MESLTQAGPRHGGAADNTEKYLYQIRNMLAWILVVMGIVIIGGVITGIVIASDHPAAAACQSQGGTDASC